MHHFTKCFILLFLSLLAGYGHSQSQLIIVRDSAVVGGYLDSAKMKIVTQSDQQFSGVMRIVNDSIIKIDRDTLSLTEIRSLKKIEAKSGIVSGATIGTGVTLFAIGIFQATNPNPVPGNPIVRGSRSFAFLVTGIGTASIGGALLPKPMYTIKEGDDLQIQID